MSACSHSVQVPARYGNGRSARRHPVTLSCADGQLRVLGKQVDACYPLASVRLAEPFAHAASLVYFNDGAHCEVAAADHPDLAALIGHRPSLVMRWQRQWRAVLASCALLAGVIAAGAIWGLPVAASALTALLPRAADLHIGALAQQAFTARGLTRPTTLDPAQQGDLRRAWTTVQPARPRMPMQLLLRAMPESIGPNALALPDGTVILNDAMARKILGGAARFDAAQAAAAAGVLAHEIGHIEGRHSMRAVVRASLTTAFAAFLFGDFSAVAAGAPAVLLGARHSRAMESEADAYALATLQAHHLPAAPLADLFASMGRDEKEPGWLGAAAGYLSSHPGSAARAEALHAADQAASTSR
ncbi:MAG TPA: M48 family metallopeptidase [Telluria sp.]